MRDSGKRKIILRASAAALAVLICAGLLSGCAGGGIGGIDQLIPGLDGNRINDIIDGISDNSPGGGSDSSSGNSSDNGTKPGDPNSGTQPDPVGPGTGTAIPDPADQEPVVPVDVDGNGSLEAVSRTLGLPYIGGQSFTERFRLADLDTYRMEKTLADANGWIAAIERDFDGDRLPEILVVTLRGGTAENALTLHMLESRNGSWYEAAAFSDQDIDESLAWTATPARWDVFVSGSDPAYIYIEHYSDEYHFADGTSWWLSRLAYDNESFSNVLFGPGQDLDLGFAGSDIMAWLDMDPSEAYDAAEAARINDYINAFRQAGLHVPDSISFTEPFMNDEASAVPLARIIRYETSETREDYTVRELIAETSTLDLTAAGTDLRVAEPEDNSAPSALPSPAGTVDGYIIPDSSTRLLTAEDLAGLTTEELRIARNEIYARHGRIFRDPVLQAYFESQSWYHGTIPADEFSGTLLSSIEMANAVFIRDEEARRTAG